MGFEMWQIYSCWSKIKILIQADIAIETVATMTGIGQVAAKRVLMSSNPKDSDLRINAGKIICGITHIHAGSDFRVV